jgi:hypothetical protein
MYTTTKTNKKKVTFNGPGPFPPLLLPHPALVSHRPEINHNQNHNYRYNNMPGRKPTTTTITTSTNITIAHKSMITTLLPMQQLTSRVHALVTIQVLASHFGRICSRDRQIEFVQS